jgi:thiol-disulfide isomerase/thioredoxin
MAGHYSLGKGKDSKMRTSLACAVALWLVSFALPAVAQQASETATPAAGGNATDQASADNETPAEEKEEAEVFDELKFVNEFQRLLREEKYEEAEKRLNETIEKHPEAIRLPQLHGTAYSHLRRANRREDALRHMSAYVVHQMKNAAKNDRYTAPFSQLLGLLVDETNEVSGPERAAEVLDDFAKRAEGLADTAPHVAGAIESRRLLYLVKADRADEAKARVEERLTAATAALAQSPDEAALILRKAAALGDRFQLEDALEGGDPNAAWTTYSEFLLEQAQKHRDLRAVRQRFATEHLNRAMTLASSDPDAADAVLKQLEGVIEAEAADTEEEPSDDGLSEFEPQIAQVKGEIAQQRRLLALVGSPAAFPENVDGWVNGEPQTRESLKGKVVLLDFFAVWCGPCIATFPHLRQWHDDYADKGLAIIGVTNYYKYGWDEDAGRPVRAADIEPEAERAAMEQFIAHHELRHPVAYLTDRQLQEFYVVNGIPHAVVIDRRGNVRLFRIGSGEANAADLEKAIKECLEESPPEA